MPQKDRQHTIFCFNDSESDVQYARLIPGFVILNLFPKTSAALFSPVMNPVDLENFSWLSGGFNKETVFPDSMGLRRSCELLDSTARTRTRSALVTRNHCTNDYVYQHGEGDKAHALYEYPVALSSQLKKVVYVCGLPFLFP